jgi:hypothetical protein
MSDGGNAPAATLRRCIDRDERADGPTIAITLSMTGVCSKPDVQNVGTSTVVDTVCKIGPSTFTSHSVSSFDDSAYSLDLTTKWEGGPPRPGMPAEGTRREKIDAKWIGECNAGHEPRDFGERSSVTFTAPRDTGTRGERILTLQDIQNLIHDAREKMQETQSAPREK